MFQTGQAFEMALKNLMNRRPVQYNNGVSLAWDERIVDGVDADIAVKISLWLIFCELEA